MRRKIQVQANRAIKECSTWPSGPERTLLWLCSLCVLLTLLVVDLPGVVLAADLVNINTATLQELDDNLPGVGPTIAQSIIDNRPYATIEEISRAKGIGEPGSKTYEDIKYLITVGAADTAQTPTEEQAQDNTPPPQTSSQTTAGSEPVPPLTAEITAPVSYLAGAGGYFSGRAFGTVGEPVANARYIWNFGDGTTVEGQKVLHTYAYPGTYVLILTVASGYSSGSTNLSIKVSPAQVALVTENDNSLLVQNNSTQQLDIGFWQLQCPTTSFLIPEQTIVLAQGGVRFSPSVTGVACGTQAELVYPSGAVAALAQVSADSPLHGQPVAPRDLQKATVAGAGVVSPARAAASVPQPADDVPQKSLLVAAGMALPAGAEWFVALLALVLLGTAGVFIAQSQKIAVIKNETKTPKDEFEIVDN